MKTSLYAFTLLFFLFPQIVKADPYRGLYGGAQLGWGQLKLTDKSTTNIANTPNALKASGNNLMIPLGFHFGMSSCSSGNIYFAGEVGMDIFVKGGAQLYSPYLTGRLGYRVHERVVTYLTAGPALGIFMVDTKAKKTKTKFDFGLRPGIGATLAMNDKMLIGAEYNYTRYSEFDYKATVNGATVKAKYRPETHTVMARISYVF